MRCAHYALCSLKKLITFVWKCKLIELADEAAETIKHLQFQRTDWFVACGPRISSNWTSCLRFTWFLLKRNHWSIIWKVLFERQLSCYKWYLHLGVSHFPPIQSSQEYSPVRARTVELVAQRNQFTITHWLKVFLWFIHSTLAQSNDHNHTTHTQTHTHVRHSFPHKWNSRMYLCDMRHIDTHSTHTNTRAYFFFRWCFG